MWKELPAVSRYFMQELLFFLILTMHEFFFFPYSRKGGLLHEKLLIIGLLLCLMSGCQKNTGTFAQGDKNLSSVFADINEQIADGAFSIPLLKDTALSEREVETLYQLDMTK